MGTNYFLVIPSCPTCGRGNDKKHIGKSSGGWCFSLRVSPDEGIESLADWVAQWAPADRIIRDEYGREISPTEMLAIIADRERVNDTPLPDGWYRQNEAELGPNGLARHRIGRFCIGHGDGTYDLVSGEFS